MTFTLGEMKPHFSQCDLNQNSTTQCCCSSDASKLTQPTEHSDLDYKMHPNEKLLMDKVLIPSLHEAIVRDISNL